MTNGILESDRMVQGHSQIIESNLGVGKVK